MTPTPNNIDKIDEAVRDICSVAMTAAPKSKVRAILTDLYEAGRIEGRKENTTNGK